MQRSGRCRLPSKPTDLRTTFKSRSIIYVEKTTCLCFDRKILKWVILLFTFKSRSTVYDASFFIHGELFIYVYIFMVSVVHNGRFRYLIGKTLCCSKGQIRVNLFMLIQMMRSIN
ncbi:hypothetical protein Hanom_Chr09g00793711 [Helianthus anomalus]